MEIESFLTLSTAHLSEETRRFMEETPERLPMSLWNCEHGWFLYAKAANPSPARYTIPDDLADCMAFAIAAGTPWLRLDRDGEIEPGLKTYSDWD